MARRDVTLHKTSPFIKKLEFLRTKTKRVVVNKDIAVIDTKTGEVDNTAEIVQRQRVDAESFVKVYTGGLRDFFGLKPSAFRLVQVIFHQLQFMPHAGQVYLNLDVAQDVLTKQTGKPLSKGAFHTAVNELIHKEFIAASNLTNLYWINPTLFFSGDRVRFVKEYINSDAGQESMALEEPAPTPGVTSQKEIDHGDDAS